MAMWEAYLLPEEVSAKHAREVLDFLNQAPDAKTQSVGLVRDPVCGTFILPSKALTSGSGSNTRYFCSEKCRRDYGGRA